MSRYCWTLSLGALALLACAGQDGSPPPAVQTTVSDTTLAVSLNTDRAVYTRGEAITITFGANSRPSTRAAMAVGHALDMADHYSQLANYMRLNNMLPPTALPRPARP